ncbi:MAG: zinc-dependent alcohol dehydrogenase [Sulfitobacter sp.]
MRAMVYEGVETLALREVPLPEPQAGEALIKLAAVGICGSDMHAYLGHDARRPAPLILGHEAAGTIASGAREGARVAVNPLVSCTRCALCRAGRENLCAQRQIISMPPREGAFAQYAALPERNLVDVPDHVPLEIAALAEPLAVSWHAARLGLDALCGGANGSALVIGGGAIGLGAALCLGAMGIAEVTVAEPNAARREYLKARCGVRAVAQAEGEFSLIVDAVGLAATRAAASALASPGGVIVHVGLGEDRGGLDIRRMTLQEITLIGTYTYSAQDFRDTCAAMFDGKLGPLDWAELRPLAQGPQAFADMRAGKVAAPKIILTPWE